MSNDPKHPPQCTHVWAPLTLEEQERKWNTNALWTLQGIVLNQ